MVESLFVRTTTKPLSTEAFSVLRTIQEKQGIRITGKEIQRHSILERKQRDEKHCEKYNNLSNNQPTTVLSEESSSFQPIKRNEVRVPSIQSRYSGEKPWNSKSEMIPKWWPQLTSLSTNQGKTPLSKQSANVVSLKEANSKAQEKLYYTPPQVLLEGITPNKK